MLVPPSSPAAPAPRLAWGFRALAAITLGLLVFGATVRVHGAGLACPDWPLCFGEVVPQLNFQVFLEWGHRTLAGSVSLGFLALGFLVLREEALRHRVGGLVLTAAAVLAAQIVLGGLTVLKLLAFWSVTLHLLCGNLFLGSLLGVAHALGTPSTTPIRRAVRRHTLAAVVVWFGQLALGGLVSSNHAGLACTEWPTCSGGEWFPSWAGPTGLALLHRVGAYVLAATVIGSRIVTRGDEELRWLADLALGLVLVQVGLGIANVLLAIPVELAILHSAVADLLGVALVSSAWRVWDRPVVVPGRVSPPILVAGR